jgi:hypothetical protein
MYKDDLFDKEDMFNRFIQVSGLQRKNRRDVSIYVAFVKLKKIFNHTSEEDFERVNKIRSGNNVPFKEFAVSPKNIIRILDSVSHDLLLKCLYVAQTDGAFDAMLFLFNFKNYDLNMKFLKDYFSNPPSLPQISVNDIP